ncbi:tetratricopeptide repeat-containing sulfotransferase family protein [Amphiplicatus metriothermophilus]|uniref:Flp pilus assembly protein TadD, contains TPR repeats n=1 Tax=Amphiplicatus metriothermophilus TaxID=1519374 RepID=A0A239PMR6_9PROT|nr:tetratricopeptide repeat-containing sulfotransferase family protein [Amphiplicatus metriothermophilus]MBB5517240.1 tetratricopeptide (TPR) repeat protein [Amphiplicatus metriothermophilus]SNT68424.1 Flp pilus assembly protein TadD, contains TPR repeats [Amphiplicatus metriothermophilus]
MTPEQKLLADARAARLADDYDAAMRLCRAFLAMRPGDPEGESFLGLCRIETGDRAGAALIERAAESAPDNPVVALYHSMLREREGALREAVVSANRAAANAPGLFEAWAQLGKLLGQAGKYAEALTALRQACRLNPDHPGAALLLAGAALETDDLETCEQALAALETTGAGAQVLRLRAHLARKRGRWSDLEAAATAWLETDPSAEEARIALAYALSQQGYYDQACAVYAPLAAGPAPRAEHLAALGRYKLGGRRLEEAVDCFNRALARDPACAEAIFGLARCSLFRGALDDAAGFCRRALEADPRHAEAWGLLVDATDGRVDDAELAQIGALAEEKTWSPEARATLLFAKGDALHRRKDAAGAFEAWSAANAVKRAQAETGGHAYRRDEQEALTRKLRALFPADPLEGAPWRDEGADGDPAPIFIVGMPRSGTTLLENALAAHPHVTGAGEVPALPFILGEFLAWAERTGWKGGPLPADARAAWRRLYFDQCAKYAVGGRARFVADKQPQNFLAVGLIRRLFPEARVIHIRRNPVETGFSIFRRNFTRQWPFATDLSDIGHYYGEYARIAAHWAEAIGPGIAFVQYEDLIADFEAQIRRLIDFCGLGWDERCLEYYKADRPVLTFSATQVRKAPSREHLRATAAYKAFLAPLKQSLAAAGVELETGALRA